MLTMLCTVGGLLLLCLMSNAVINTGLTVPGVREEFQERFDTTPADYTDLSIRVPSTTKVESLRWLGAAPRMRKLGTGRLAKGLTTEKYDVESKVYEATIEVDRVEAEDDQTTAIKTRIGELADVSRTHPDYLLEQLLINGGTEGFLAYDGKTFFAEDHESGGSGVQSNIVASDVADEDAITTVEFRKSLCLAIARLVAFKDETGQARRIRPSGLVIVVPPTLLFTALEAIDLQLVAQSTNPLGKNVIQNIARVVCFPGLTVGTRYYVLKTDASVRPFAFIDRMPLEFRSFEGDSEEGWKTEKYQYGVRARYEMAYALWYYALQVDLAEAGN